MGLGIGRKLRKSFKTLSAPVTEKDIRRHGRKISQEFEGFSRAVGDPEVLAKDAEKAAKDAARQEEVDAAARRRALFARQPGRRATSRGRQSTILTGRLGGDAGTLG